MESSPFIARTASEVRSPQVPVMQQVLELARCSPSSRDKPSLEDRSIMTNKNMMGMTMTMTTMTGKMTNEKTSKKTNEMTILDMTVDNRGEMTTSYVSDVDMLSINIYTPVVK